MLSSSSSISRLALASYASWIDAACTGSEREKRRARKRDGTKPRKGAGEKERKREGKKRERGGRERGGKGRERRRERDDRNVGKKGGEPWQKKYPGNGGRQHVNCVGCRERSAWQGRAVPTSGVGTPREPKKEKENKGTKKKQETPARFSGRPKK